MTADSRNPAEKSMNQNDMEENAIVAALLSGIEGGLELVRTIGKGSLGTVYECADKNGTPLAVKLMQGSPMIEPDTFENIITAALKTRSISETTRVVKVISAGKIENFYYILMELFKGGTLEAVLAKNNLSIKDKVRIGAEIAKTLADIHSKGIVHNDLKPSNVLLDKDNVPYLNDFYLFVSRPSKPFSGMPQGTPYYMSPEQASGQIPAVTNDSYSFGVLLYELLTNSMPYREHPRNITEMIHVVTEGKIVRPSKKNSAINAKIEAIILKLLSRDLETRYRDMNVVASDLLASISGKQISIPYRKSMLSKVFTFFGSN
ncbi:MAG: serine/threonine protein kinase [Victivallales bacterium]|nr:serine/threonine protein kinase [Victivallales bacterium]